MIKIVKMNHLDRVGATASFLCAIHCMAMPLVLTALPFVGSTFLVDDRFEISLIVVSCGLALSSVCFGFIKHRQPILFLFFSFALVCIILAHHFEHSSLWAAFYMAGGGFLFAVTHVINYKLCNSCHKCKVQ